MTGDTASILAPFIPVTAGKGNEYTQPQSLHLKKKKEEEVLKITV